MKLLEVVMAEASIKYISSTCKKLLIKVVKNPFRLSQTSQSIRQRKKVPICQYGREKTTVASRAGVPGAPEKDGRVH